MSEVMLHGVLNMPIEMWGDGHLDKIQRHSRYVEASELIKKLEAECELYKRDYKVDVKALIDEYNSAADEHGWVWPHPIFLMACEIDRLAAQLKTLKEGQIT